MSGFEADAQAFESRCRARAWAAEAKEEPAVLERARLHEAGEMSDDNPHPDPDDYPEDAAWDAAVAAWETCNAADEVLDARAARVVSERILGRMPWSSALRMRLIDAGMSI